MASTKDPQRVLLGEREVDPEGALPPDERARRAEMARKAHFTRLPMLSAKARRKRAARRGPATP